MVKIMETNVLVDENDVLRDIQSRAIEADSWNAYVDEIEGKTSSKNKICLLGGVSGRSKQFIEGRSHYVKKTEYNFIIDHGDSLQMAYLIPEVKK